jgi:hypothetical protein
MRREIRMWKSNPREATHPHVRVGKFENALREKNQPDRQADQHDARRTLWGDEKEPQQ